jgi:uncharacterized membrane protein
MSDGRATMRAVQIVLFVSLALNLLLAGFVGGRLLAPLYHHPPEHTPAALIERLVRALPERDGTVLRAAFKANAAKIATLAAELEQARLDVRLKLSAEPFDKAALEAAMNKARDKRMALYKAMQSVVLDAVGNLSPEGRSRLWTGHEHG